MVTLARGVDVLQHRIYLPVFDHVPPGPRQGKRPARPFGGRGFPTLSLQTLKILDADQRRERPPPLLYKESLPTVTGPRHQLRQFGLRLSHPHLLRHSCSSSLLNRSS